MTQSSVGWDPRPSAAGATTPPPSPTQPSTSSAVPTVGEPPRLLVSHRHNASLTPTGNGEQSGQRRWRNADAPSHRPIVNTVAFIFYLSLLSLLHSNFGAPSVSGAPLQFKNDAIRQDEFPSSNLFVRMRRSLRKRHIASSAPFGDSHGDFDVEPKAGRGSEGREGYDFAAKYLAEFGYLSQSKLATPRELRDALRAFQDMTGLPATGRLDRVTVALMTQPRCGNSDVSRSRERRKRFVYVSRWENKVQDNQLRLSWYIENYTEDIPRDQIKSTVRQAFELWSSQIKISSMESLSLVFEEAESADAADITILWAEGDHGDAHKFDGPGLDGSNILAHTFYPNYQSRGTLNGDIHLDDYERWHVNGSRDGASFPHVLVHEIGHTLGLGHSKKQQAIMYPIYRKEQLELMQLDLDDKCAINWSYIGASDLCLYIWLLSEVLPKKIAIEKDATYMIEDDNTDVWEAEERARRTPTTGGGGAKLPTPLRVTEVFERKLRHVRIPLCRDNNKVQNHMERMLIQRLSFPRQLAQQYGDIVCQFLDGLHAQYGMAVTDNFHEVFRIHGTHNYFQDDEKFRALEQSGLRDRKFDARFFKWLSERKGLLNQAGGPPPEKESFRAFLSSI